MTTEEIRETLNEARQRVREEDDFERISDAIIKILLVDKIDKSNLTFNQARNVLDYTSERLGEFRITGK